MKFFKQRVVEKSNQRVDPRSKEFVFIIQNMLKEGGITNNRALNECTHRLLKVSQTFFKGLKEEVDIQDNEVDALESRFRETLVIYGITNDEHQDKIIMGFFGALTDIGGK